MGSVERWLAAVVGMLVLLAGVGMWLLWPEGGVSGDEGELPEQYGGVVRDVEQYECPSDPNEFGLPRSRACQVVTVRLRSGPEAGETFEFDTGDGDYPTFREGDRVLVGFYDGQDGAPEYYVSDFDRGRGVLLLVAVFAAAVLLVGRRHGLRSLVGLVISLAVIVVFVVPAVIEGRNPLAVALVGSFAVMIVTLYLSHGFTVKTTAALVGTSVSFAVTALLGVFFVDLLRITGYASEEAMFVRSAAGGLDLRGLVLAGLVIGALGVLDDVAVGQSSTAFAVHDANPQQSWRELFGRAMRVGRDHIAAVVNTLVFAYVGASMALMVLFSTSGVPFGEILTSEVVAQELVVMLVGSLGLIAAVPVTTALATTLAIRQRPRTPPAVDYLGEDVDEDELTEEQRDHRRWARFVAWARDEDDDADHRH